jgi:hypothetical protein
MTETTPAHSTSLLRGAAIVLMVMVLTVLVCNFVPLLTGVIELDIPAPPSSIVSTSRYRTAPAPFGELAWDRHYLIPSSTLSSLDAVQQYFDTWITDHEWETYYKNRCSITNEEVDTPVTEYYIPVNWGWPNYPPGICLMITPTPQDGSYDVRLITYQPGLFTTLN